MKNIKIQIKNFNLYYQTAFLKYGGNFINNIGYLISKIINYYKNIKNKKFINNKLIILIRNIIILFNYLYIK